MVSGSVKYLAVGPSSFQANDRIPFYEVSSMGLTPLIWSLISSSSDANVYYFVLNT
jgi:hypothetical protein